MSVNKKKKQLVAADLAALMIVGAGVPVMVANSPIAFAGGSIAWDCEDADSIRELMLTKM